MIRYKVDWTLKNKNTKALQSTIHTLKLFLSAVEQWSTCQSSYSFIPSDKFLELHLFHRASQEYLALVILPSLNSSYAEKKTTSQTAYNALQSLLQLPIINNFLLSFRDLKPPVFFIYYLFCQLLSICLSMCSAWFCKRP